MKKVTFLAISVIALSLTSCRGYEREQDRLDRESEGKGELLKAESTKKVKIEQAKADYESAKLDAQTKMTRAEAEAKSKLIQAEADAKVRMMHAESQAKANVLLSNSLSPTLIEYNKINRWNGKLPETSVGSGSQSIISIK
jgi:regulator of protease activity HflC (stomatin/prohibitin superfamily)